MPYENALLQSLFDNSKQILFIIKIDFTIVKVNEVMRKKMEIGQSQAPILLDKLLDKQAHKLFQKHVASKELSFSFNAILTPLNTQKHLAADLAATYINDPINNFEGYLVRAREIANELKMISQIINQNNKLSAIFESGTQHVFTFNNKLIITQFNKNLYTDTWSYFNYALQKDKSSLKTWIGVIAKDYYEVILSKTQLVFNGIAQQFDIQFKLGNNIVWREVFLYPIKNEHNQIAEIVGISHNISARKKAERQLKLQESKLLALLDSGTHHIYSITQNGTLHAFNANFQDFCRRYFSIELEDNNTSIFDVYSTEIQKLKNHIRLAFKGIPQFFEISTTPISGNTKYYEMYFTPIVEAEPDIIEVSVLSINITENHNNNIKLFNQAAKLNTVIETSSLIFFTLSNGFSLTSFNSRFEELYVNFFSQQPVLGVSVAELAANFPKENMQWLDEFLNFWQIHFNSVLQGINTSFEHKFTSLVGDSYWFDIIMAPIFDNENKVSEISIIGQLANDRKQTELKLKQSLQEKEVLLREVHHRVKNNLQVISSLLNLQADFVEDKNILKVLKESQNRVKSMSYIHEILYQTNEFGNIPFEQYLKSILYNLVDSYRKVGVVIEVETNFENINIDLDTSIPCGLIVNELVSNSLKYAFEGRDNGSIKMTCKNVGEKVVLSIKDNGRGFPENFNVKTAHSLGMQLVFALIEQIDGKIEIINDNGSEFLISFASRK